MRTPNSCIFTYTFVGHSCIYAIRHGAHCLSNCNAQAKYIYADNKIIRGEEVPAWVYAFWVCKPVFWYMASLCFLHILYEPRCTVKWGGVRYMAERRKRPKKVAENWKKTKTSTGKGNSPGNHKKLFLSHGKPEKVSDNCANRKTVLKSWGSRKVCLKAVERRKDPKRQWKFAETGKSEKKGTESQKNQHILAGNRKGTPSYTPSWNLMWQ